MADLYACSECDNSVIRATHEGTAAELLCASCNVKLDWVTDVEVVYQTEDTEDEKAPYDYRMVDPEAVQGALNDHRGVVEYPKEEWSGKVDGCQYSTEVYAPSKWTPERMSPFSLMWSWTGEGDHIARHMVGDRDWADDVVTIDSEVADEGDISKRQAAEILDRHGRQFEALEGE